jgi:hypothetical protein
MDSLDPLFWTGCALVLARILNGGNPRLWMVFGLIAGLGINNKHIWSLGTGRCNRKDHDRPR